MHRVEDNLPGKQEPIITVQTFRGPIKSRTKDMLPLPSAGKHFKLVSSAGKHVTCVKRGKICNGCQV